MGDRYEAVLAWAADRGFAAAVERYEPVRDRRAATDAGRRAATAALAALGGPALDGAHHDDGRPVWPDGWTGSISRRDGDAIAVVARRGAIGIDLERRGALPIEDAVTVLDDDELGHAVDDDGATERWSAKEAAFKAWNEAARGALPSPIDPRRHLHVTIDGDVVRVEPRHELAAAAPVVEGRIFRSGGWTVVAVSRPAAGAP